MAPGTSSTKDDRERDNRARYRVAGYHWSPDSQHILFDANGQLWYFTLATGTAVELSSPGEAAVDPKFSPDGKHVSYVRRHNLVVRPIDGNGEKALTNDKNTNDKSDKTDKTDKSEDLFNGAGTTSSFGRSRVMAKTR